MLNIYVGNIAATTTEHTLRALFEPYGQVLSVRVVTDCDSGGPRGFAFVEMNNEAEAQQAISKLSGTILDERQLTINEARPKKIEDKPFDEGMRSHRQHRY